MIIIIIIIRVIPIHALKYFMCSAHAECMNIKIVLMCLFVDGEIDLKYFDQMAKTLPTSSWKCLFYYTPIRTINTWSHPILLTTINCNKG